MAAETLYNNANQSNANMSLYPAGDAPAAAWVTDLAYSNGEFTWTVQDVEPHWLEYSRDGGPWTAFTPQSVTPPSTGAFTYPYTLSAGTYRVRMWKDGTSTLSNVTDSFTVTGGAGGGNLVFQDDFSNGLGAWSSVGSDVQIVQNDQGMPYSVRCFYNTSAGTNGRTCYRNIYSEGLYEAFLEFDAKATADTNAKWLKLHGYEDPGNDYANTTVTRAADGRIHILHGNASQPNNDTQRVMYGDGVWTGSGVGQIDVANTPRLSGNDQWKHFKVRIKHDPNAGGEYEVWEEDQLKLAASGITNMQAQNNPIEFVGLFDYSNGSQNQSGYLSFANLVVSKNGWIN